jgi:cell division protein FtsW
MAIAIGIIGLLLLAEPDMGAFMVISVIAMGYSVSGGASTPGCFISAVVIRRVRLDDRGQRLAA